MTRSLYQQEFWGPREKKHCRCADCGRTRQEASQIDVHHINPRGGDGRDNLVSLCRRCHFRSRHRRDRIPGDGPFEPDQPRSIRPKTPSAATLSPGL